MWAAFNGQLQSVRLVLEAGEDLGAWYGQTALLLAASCGHTSCITALLEAGVDVDAEDTCGHTPLMGAAVGGHIESMKT